MPSIKNIVLALAMAAAVSAQGVTVISDGQPQVPTVTMPLSTAPAPTTVATVISTGSPSPSTNGTFTTGAPSSTASPFPGAANMLAWSKEVVIGAAGVAVGLALL
ncbi:hypothetical protein MMC22_006510 [Lobaria immixta]|nr:hypothetical protein [Lobaria immixta]